MQCGGGSFALGGRRTPVHAQRGVHDWPCAPRERTSGRDSPGRAGRCSRRSGVLSATPRGGSAHGQAQATTSRLPSPPRAGGRSSPVLRSVGAGRFTESVVKLGYVRVSFGLSTWAGHQIRRPISTNRAGTTTVRTTNVSSKNAKSDNDTQLCEHYQRKHSEVHRKLRRAQCPRW